MKYMETDVKAERSASGESVRADTRFILTAKQFHVLALVLLALSLLKGLRLPTRFALTHYVFSYDDGFVRRGLWGSLLTPFEPFSYWRLAGIALVLLTVLILIGWRLARQDEKAGIASALPWLAFLASPGLVFLFHIVGYLDYLLIISVWALLLSSQRLGAARTQLAIYLLAPVTLMLHEAAIAIVIPALFLILVAQAGDTWRAVKRGTVLAAITLVSLLAVLHFGTLDDSVRDDVHASLDARASFELRHEATDALFHRLGDRLDRMQEINSNKGKRRKFVSSLLLFMPTTLFFLWLALTQWKARDPRTRTLVVAMSVVGVGLAPMLLHLVAYDLHRWHALTNVAAFTTWLIMIRSRADDEAMAKASLGTTLLIVFLCLSSTNYFFGNYQPNHFPEYGHVRHLFSWGDDAAIP
jgi:hypothetical protein